MKFRETFSYGRVGESRIANWFKGRGFSILPVYEIEIEQGKGPRLFTPDEQLIAPDMLIFRANGTCWIEAKHKTAFSWHRITQKWVTGIDIKHYEDYCNIAQYSEWPIWLLFLHEGGQAKDSPPNSPSGLFGNSLKYLIENENHRHENWGKGGMVYWSIEHLKQLATLEEI